MKIKIEFENCDQVVLKNGARLILCGAHGRGKSSGADAILCVNKGLSSEFRPFGGQAANVPPMTVRRRLLVGDITAVHTYGLFRHAEYRPAYVEQIPGMLGSPNALQKCHDYGSKIRILFLREEHERIHSA